MAERVERYNPYGWQYRTAVSDNGAEIKFSGSQAVDSNGNCIVVLGSTIYSINISGGVNWSNQDVGQGAGLIGTQPSILSDNTVVVGSPHELGGAVHYFAASDGAHTYYGGLFEGDSPRGLCVFSDDSVLAWGGGSIAKISSDRVTQLWSKRLWNWGLDPQIIGVVLDANGYIYLWYDMEPGINIYDSTGTFVKTISDTGDVVDPDTGNPVTLLGITGVAFAEDGSLILGINNTMSGWSGIVSLQSAVTPPDPPATGSPIISNAAGRRGIGTNTEGGSVPWGP